MKTGAEVKTGAGGSAIVWPEEKSSGGKGAAETKTVDDGSRKGTRARKAPERFGTAPGTFDAVGTLTRTPVKKKKTGKTTVVDTPEKDSPVKAAAKHIVESQWSLHWHRNSFVQCNAPARSAGLPHVVLACVPDGEKAGKYWDWMMGLVNTAVTTNTKRVGELEAEEYQRLAATGKVCVCAYLGAYLGVK